MQHLAKKIPMMLFWMALLFWCQPSNQAHAKDGFYITPNAEVIMVSPTFTQHTNKIGIGGGGGLAMGYEIKKFQIELATNYEYYGSQTNLQQGLKAFAKYPNSEKIKTSTDNSEYFLPITLGLNYAIPLTPSDSWAMTVGMAGGAWIHYVNRATTIDTSALTAVSGAGRPMGGPVGGPLDKDTIIQKTTQIRGVVVPSLGINYAPATNWILSLAGKFYIVPFGYSDNYTAESQAVANKTVRFLSPVYNAVDKIFWYGAINLGVGYSF